MRKKYILLRIAHERELREQSERLHDEARRLQAAEYERRLNDLNNSHERALAEARRVVPQTEFEIYKETTRRELGLALSSNSNEIETERQARIRAEGQISTWRFLVLLLGLPGLAGLVIALISAFGPKGT